MTFSQDLVQDRFYLFLLITWWNCFCETCNFKDCVKLDHRYYVVFGFGLGSPFFLVVVKSSKVANYLFRFHLTVFIEWHICSRECLNLLLRSPFSQSPPRKELAFYPSFNYHNMDRFHNIPSFISIWIKWIVFYFSFFKRRRQYANTLRGILKLLRVAENEFREFIYFYT